MKVLAIDIGGTKSALALCTVSGGRVESVSARTSLVSRDYTSLVAMIKNWQIQHPGQDFDAVGAGVAGPVVRHRVHLTNLGWDIDAVKISQEIGRPVKICNDMQAHGFGILGLTEENIRTLNTGAHVAGAKALIAAGTGLGEAVIGWNGENYFPTAGEGGHSSFSPTTDQEIRLLEFLRGRLQGHVSWERVLGGLDGWKNLALFLAQESKKEISSYLNLETPDWGATLVQAAQHGDQFAAKVIEFYALLYGKEAANLALKCMPCGGVYLGGGVAPKIIPWLQKYFMIGFRDKGRFGPLLDQTPVHVILDPLNGLKGAALQFASAHIS